MTTPTTTRRRAIRREPAAPEVEKDVLHKEWLIAWVATAIVVAGIVAALVFREHYTVTARWPWDPPADRCATLESALLRDLCHAYPKE